MAGATPEILSLPQIVQLLNAAGTLGALVVALYGGIRGWWFPSWYVEELRQKLSRLESDKSALTQDRDEWKELAHSSTRNATDGADLVRQLISAMAPRLPQGGSAPGDGRPT